MSDIVERLRQASLNQGDYRWEAADEIECLRQVLENSQQARVLQGKTIIDAANEIERLRAALRDLLRLVEDDIEEDDSPPYLIDQVCDRARAALEGK